MVMRGERPPKASAWRQATIGNAAERDDEIRLLCDGCRRDILVFARDFAERHQIPLNTPWWTLAQRLRCSACRSRRVGIMMTSKSGYDAAARAERLAARKSKPTT
jgi:hypothetical protein